MTRLGSILLFLLVAGLPYPAWSNQTDRYDAVLFARALTEPQAPTTVGNYIVFSYADVEQPPPRYVAAAFQHEEYSQLHLFSKTATGLCVLIYQQPQQAGEILYRLVVDGIWLNDPANPHTIRESGALLSALSFGSQESDQTRSGPTVADGRASFTLKRDDVEGLFLIGVDGRRHRFDRPFEELDVRLVGSFSDFDPFLHILRLVDGEFVLELSLPPGDHGYYFLVDGQRILDPANPESLYGRGRSRYSKIAVDSR